MTTPSAPGARWLGRGAPHPPGQPDARLVLLHLPKTGGTTLTHALRAGFPPEQVCPERFNELYRYAPEDLARWRLFSGHFGHATVARIPGPLQLVTAVREPRARLISLYAFWKRHVPGHIERHGLIGAAAARRSRDLGAFLAAADAAVLDGVDNPMARQLAGNVQVRPEGYFEDDRPVSPEWVRDTAVANLARIEFVGTSDDLDGLYRRVAYAWGLPPLPTLPRLNSRDRWEPALEPAEPVIVPPDAEALVARATWLDQAVWEAARRLAGAPCAGPARAADAAPR